MNGRMAQVRFVAGDPAECHDADWFQHWTLDDTEEPWLSAARRDCGYLLRFHDVADFEITSPAHPITVRPRRGSDPQVVRRMALGQVLPRALSLQSPPVLHASAVARGDAALAFAGASRAGKSSLASALTKAGCALLADDFVHVVERDGTFWCNQTASEVWIDDGASAWLGRSEMSADPPARSCRLRRIFVLDPIAEGGVPSACRMSPREALVVLFAQSYRIDSRHPEMLAREFERLTSLVVAVPTYRLNLPRGFAHLPETVALLLDKIG